MLCDIDTTLDERDQQVRDAVERETVLLAAQQSGTHSDRGSLTIGNSLKHGRPRQDSNLRPAVKEEACRKKNVPCWLVKVEVVGSNPLIRSVRDVSGRPETSVCYVLEPHTVIRSRQSRPLGRFSAV